MVKRATQGLSRLCGCLKRRVGRGRWPWRNNFLGISNCWADWFWIHLLHQLWKVTLINQLLCPCQSGHLTRTHINRVFSGIFDTSLASLARNCTYTKKWTVAPLLGVLWRHSSLVSLLITETRSSSFPEGAQASLGCRRWWNYGLVETWILISGVKWEVEIFPIHPNISYTEQFQICTLIYTGSVKWEGERVLLILVSLISEYFEYSNRPIKVLRGKYSSISIPHIRVGSAKWVGEEKRLFEKKHIFQCKNHKWYEDEANS